LQGDTYSFVIRIWHEAIDGEGHITTWRGSIDYVGGDERAHFDDLNRIVQFIQQQVGLESQCSPSSVNAITNPDTTDQVNHRF
jgi:hypothetical protein